MKQAKLLEAKGLENWAVLCLCRNLTPSDVQKYAQDLAGCCAALGICILCFVCLELIFSLPVCIRYGP